MVFVGVVLDHHVEKGPLYRLCAHFFLLFISLVIFLILIVLFFDLHFIFLYLFVNLFYVIKMQITHRLSKIKLLGLKEIFISLKLEFVGFVTACQQELEVFEHHWFHVKEHINIQLMQGLYLKRVEQLDLDDIRG